MFKLFKYFKGKTFGVLASAVLLIFLSSLFHIIQPIFVNWCISIVGAINNPTAAGEPIKIISFIVFQIPYDKA